jgi:hypothetical protein
MEAIFQKPEFCQQPLGGFCYVGQAESLKRLIFHQNTSFDPRDHMLSQKLFVDVGIDAFPGKKPAICGINLLDLLLIPLVSLLSTPSP